MWILNVMMAAVGLLCGIAAAAGTFALIASLGLIPRLAGKTSVASFAIPLENAVIFGGVCGGILAVFPKIPLPLGNWFAVLYGLASGIFVGCLSVALAEVLNVFPVLYRRMQLKTGLRFLIFVFALGKTVGALYFFTALR